MAGLADTSAQVPSLHPMPAVLAVAMVTEDDLLLQRVKMALDREGLVAHVELAGRRRPEYEHLRRRPDVVLLTESAGPALAAAAHDARRRLRDARVLLLVGAGAQRGARHLLDAGVDGIVLETELEATLAIAVRAACVGHLTLPRSMRHGVELPSFSHRERQILRLVVAGLTNDEIACRLYLAKSTIAGHLTAVFRRLGVRSRSEAVTMLLTADESLRGSVLGPDAPADDAARAG